jgi:MFS family permease
MRVEPVGLLRDSSDLPASAAPAGSSLAALSWVNFLVSMMQTGFGTFIAINLTTAQWSRTNVGLALSIAGVAGILAQVPGGALVDATSRKRLAAGVATIFVVAAAVIIAFWHARIVVLAAMALQGSASAVLTPAIAAITLALVPPANLAERLGLNMRYMALGTAMAAAAMGLVASVMSSRMSLLLAGGFGIAALMALSRIRGEDLAKAAEITDHAAVTTRAAGGQWEKRGTIAGNRHLLVFAACMLLFQLGNAGVLPLAVGSVIARDGRNGGLVVASAVIVSQILAAMLASPMGKMAEQRGRRPVLLLALLALSVKATLFAIDGSSMLVVVYQSFDAISAAALGVIVPLVVADITYKGGHFNMAMGLVGLASSVGAAAGTFMAGAIADGIGVTLAFAVLAAIGLAAALLARTMLSETGQLRLNESPMAA